MANFISQDPFQPVVDLTPKPLDTQLNEPKFLREIDDTIAFTVSVSLPDILPATAANYGIFFVAPFVATLVSASEVHGTVGGASAAVVVEKLTDTTAKGSGTAIISSFDLTATANTVQFKDITSGVVVSATSGVLDRSLAKGDRLALKSSGTLTGCKDLAITLVLKTQLSNLPV